MPGICIICNHLLEYFQDLMFLNKYFNRLLQCPKCKSRNTRMVSQFGSTACKAHYQCNECQEPFDYFKCLK